MKTTMIWVAIAVVGAIAVSALSQTATNDPPAPVKGSAHVASATTDFQRIWKDTSGASRERRVSNLAVAPVTADVKVIHYPHFANMDTFTVRAGDVVTWTSMDPGIDGFKVIRTSATVVDCYWW